MVAKPRLLGWQITPCLDSFPNLVILTLTLSGTKGKRKNPCIVAPTDSAESFSALIAEAKCRDSFAFAQDRFFVPESSALRITPFQFHLREIASTGGARQQPRMAAKPRPPGWQIPGWEITPAVG
jgi:hypothetical protein